MRYIIIFRSVGQEKRTKRVSQQVGEAIVNSFANNRNVTINGNWYNMADVESVQKISTENGFTKDYVLLEERAELRSPKELEYLKSINSPQIQCFTS